MQTEYECTMLEIDREVLEKKLKQIGAKKVGEYFQKRYTYDVKPVLDTKWVRLRTNGKKSTITIKNISDKTLIGGTQELEIEVSDFDKANLMLEELGYIHKNYQENRRIIYELGNIEVSIDKWPLIPEYAEIEGKSEDVVKEFVELLNMDYKITNFDVTSIYKDIYGIDVLSIKELKLDDENDVNS